MLFYEAAVCKKAGKLLRAIGEKSHIPQTSAYAVIYMTISLSIFRPIIFINNPILSAAQRQIRLSNEVTVKKTMKRKAWSYRERLGIIGE